MVKQTKTLRTGVVVIWSTPDRIGGVTTPYDDDYPVTNKLEKRQLKL